ncbi:MAG: SRPBCC family protein [Akkermansiaceae bacterium]|nr:SRPBCC family protein [Verrucomicrobiales bacterium]
MIPVLVALAIIGILLFVIIAGQPDEFTILRSAKISAPPENVFAQVNDFHKWEAWSPWAKLDPNAKNTFEGPPAGTGAGFAWAGNNKVGEGRMTLTESRPNDYIRINLEFLKPFKAVNTTEFTFKPDGEKTTLTWTMSGKNNFMAKAFGLFVDCDKMVGGQFEQGLANMKAIVESPAAARVH